MIREPQYAAAAGGRRITPGMAYVEFAKAEIEQSIASRFERQVELHGDRLAIKTPRMRMSYRDLNAVANRFAHAVLARAGGEAAIALLLEHGAPYIAAILGVLKAGKTYVPLDASFPLERNRHILENSGAGLMLAGSGAMQTATPLAAGRCAVMNIDELPADLSEQNPDLDIAPHHPAYIIYTSGSTGQPKGVLQNHRNVLNDVRQYTNALCIDADDRMTLLYSCSVNGAVRGVFGALLNGAALYPFDVKVQGLAGLAEMMMREEITFYHSVPTVFRHFAATLTGKEKFPKLRVIRFGGESVLAHDVALYKKHFSGDCMLYTGMGATETGHIREFFIDKQTAIADSIVPTGYAIEDKEVLLLDDDGRAVARGEIGEIAVRSAHLALGYWRKPELTRSVFLPDPDGGGRRIYRTGDLGQMRADGCLIHRGRKDFQVKIRGFRIETAEIERRLCEHPEIREAAVVAIDDPNEEKALVAYLVGKPRAIPAAELRELLTHRLPDYMAPARFIALDAMPLTPNGKLDRKALPAPDWSLDANTEAFVAPRNATESALAAIWREMLKRERIGIHDNFFDVGGHSLLGAQIAMRARDVFRVEIPLISLFEAPTIAEMAAKIERASPIVEGHEVSPIVPVSRENDIELSFGQESLWFVEQLSPGSALYNIPRPIRILGALNLAAFRQAFETIVARHESLRTIITVRDGRPIQTFSEDGPGLAIIDLRALPQAERESQALRLAQEDARRPFELAGGALMRAALLRLGECDHVLLLTIHHMISDAWSGGIFFNELNILYQDFSEQRPSPLGELPVQYADVASWQRRFLRGEALQRLLDYWKKQLADLPPVLELPSDRPRTSRLTFAGGRRFLTLPKQLGPALKRLSRVHNVTLSMTLLAVYQVLLSRYTSRTDIVVGTPIAGRSRPEMDGVMGYFINTLVLRTALSGDPTVGELLQRVKQTVLGAFAHQDLPFEKLVQELRPRRSFNHMPLCQVLFNMINSPPTTNVALSGLTLRPFDAENGAATAALEATHSTSFYSFSGTSKFDLGLFMWEDGDNLLGRVEYNSDLFDASTIAQMCGRYQNLLADIAARPDARISELAFLTEAERTKLAMDFDARKASQRSKFLNAKPKTVRLDAEQLIKTGHLQPGQTLPLVIQPNAEAVRLAEWAAANRDFIARELLKHGALLFRGFDVKSSVEFESFASALSPELFGEYGDLPREGIGGKVYASTPYPADQSILFHNESSHMHCWPMKIWFYCVKASQQGGETPIVDGREMYRRVDPRIRRRMAEKKLMYVRNYIEGLDVGWQTFFGTPRKSEVEDYCRGAGIAFEWREDGGLRTSQICPALVRHPMTSEMVWFNQVQLHHPSCLQPGLRESLLATLSYDDLPRNVLYGDGAPIEDSVMRQIGEVYQRTSVAFPWREGDVLMLNNMLVAHGCNPYAGPRKIVVAMAEMMNQKDLPEIAL